jgi:hypothetical protein
MSFQDKDGMYHDKQCIDSQPSSNNGWIYTAYAHKAKLSYNQILVFETFKKCKMPNKDLPHGIYLIRTPYRACPPISRDEILGMAALGFLKPHHLDGWNFSPYPLPKFNLITAIKQFLELRGKHRNYFWQNNMNQVYRFAFSVPLQDRHFILSKWGKFNLFYWAVAKIDSLFKPKSGMDWLKYDKGLDVMKEEFPEDHPFKDVK